MACYMVCVCLDVVNVDGSPIVANAGKDVEVEFDEAIANDKSMYFFQTVRFCLRNLYGCVFSDVVVDVQPKS